MRQGQEETVHGDVFREGETSHMLAVGFGIVAVTGQGKKA